MTDPNRPLLGEPNAPCRTCGAPLAADQRYCLQCGARRAEARLPFLDILARQSGAPRTVAPPAPPVRTGPGAWAARVSTNAAAVAGVACLLLALGVGVLIGGLGDGGSATAGTPQVITVGGVAAPVATSTTTPPVTTTPDASATANTTKKKKASSKKPKTAAASTKSKATNKALKSLDSSSGGDYAKKAAKLPKTLGTGGKPPPVDKSVPAGGGSDVQSIG
ncbi:MAG TPA: hypothetical protein VGO71_15220 [Baekduia sp.]|nr:hypothetical protein [Baekduia sp.]